MKKISKLFVLLGVAMPLAMFSVTPDAPAQTNSKPASLDSLFGNEVVAKGKGVEVKRTALDAIVVRVKAMYAAQRMPPPTDLEEQALKGLIIKQLIIGKATAADRAKGKADFETQINKLKESRGFTDEELGKQIDMQLFGGETREQWTNENVDNVTMPIVLERELNVKVTDDDVKKYYDDPANISKFEEPERVRAAHILLMTSDPETHQPLSPEKKAEKKKQMEDILKQARAGADFAELAKKYSEDPGSKDKGGEYTFPRGQMVKEFEDTAFSLKPGQISDVIETQFGYHIIKLYEKIPAKKVEFDKVKDEIKNALERQAIQKQLPDFTKKLVKEADVKILDEKLKNINLTGDSDKAGSENEDSGSSTNK